MTQASFPPLFIGQAVTGALNPFDKACSQAMLGCDAGLVVHNISPDTLRAAIVFAP
jgi:BirA family biotin operon repressor/biotin-[acetyl-CoA-carboxylase] ligase